MAKLYLVENNDVFECFKYSFNVAIQKYLVGHIIGHNYKLAP